jgi:glucose-6-phosphate isomerase
LGTRQALSEKSRESLTITVRDVTPYTVGMLIALFERAVGFYASLLNINAYHQPGVEAGKKAASAIIALESNVIRHLSNHRKTALPLSDICAGLERDEEIETIFKICEQLAANPERGIVKISGKSPFNASFKRV